MGSDAVPAFRGMPSFVHLPAVEIERYGNDLGLCALLKDPWPPSDSHQAPLRAMQDAHASDPE